MTKTGYTTQRFHLGDELMAITVKIEGGKQLARAIGNATDRAMAELLRALTVEANAVMRDSKREVPVDMGPLLSSGFVERPKLKGRGASITMGYGGAAKDYALFIHEGTGPAVGRPAFMPPVQPFKEWAKRVLGDESLGFVIARSVGQKGLKPRKYLERPLRRRSRGMGRRIARRMRKGLEKRA